MIPGDPREDARHRPAQAAALPPQGSTHSDPSSPRAVTLWCNAGRFADARDLALTYARIAAATTAPPASARPPSPCARGPAAQAEALRSARPEPNRLAEVPEPPIKLPLLQAEDAEPVRERVESGRTPAAPLVGPVADSDRLTEQHAPASVGSASSSE